MKRNLTKLTDFCFGEEEEEVIIKKRLISDFSKLSLDDNKKFHISSQKSGDTPKINAEITKKLINRSPSYKGAAFSKNKKNIDVRPLCPYSIYDVLKVDCVMKKLIDKSIELMHGNMDLMKSTRLDSFMLSPAPYLNFESNENENILKEEL